MKKSRSVQLDGLERAQELIYDAWEARSGKQALELAQKALALSPLCADAYVLLATRERNKTKALDLWRKGVAAGEAALGPSAEADYEGEYWGLLETRPFMRARHGLAMHLWTLGSHEEAIAHSRAMLRLNPNDNQGIRYILAAWYAELERDNELETLLRKYKDDYSAFWIWTKPLLAYRQNGKTKKSQSHLKKAVDYNSWVSGYLLGEKKMPKSLPQFYSSGEESEAVCYVDEFGKAWRLTEGALDWLRTHRGY